jgi:outer membrane receptor protein involved in Fe transport
MRVKNLLGDEGKLEDDYWLPAAGMVFHLGPDMKVRLNYGKTRTRPIFREKAPYPNENYALGLIESGNPDLRTTSIDNYDLRWEWFTGPGEVLSASFFWKDLQDPIEKHFVQGRYNGEITWGNVPRGRIIGLEAEVQKRLDFIGKPFQGLSVGANFTRLWSEMDFDSTALINRGEGMEKTHPVQGAADYVLNANIQYSNESAGLSAAVFLCLIGPRIAFLPTDATPPAVDYTRANLNCTLEKKFGSRLSVKATGKNLLNPEYKTGHQFKDVDYYREKYYKGITVSLSAGLRF